MNEYKGIYYNQKSTKVKYYEGGAHFKYIELFRILMKISKKEKKNISKHKELNSSNKFKVTKYILIYRILIIKTNIMKYHKNCHI